MSPEYGKAHPREIEVLADPGDIALGPPEASLPRPPPRRSYRPPHAATPEEDGSRLSPATDLPPTPGPWRRPRHEPCTWLPRRSPCRLRPIAPIAGARRGSTAW